MSIGIAPALLDTDILSAIMRQQPAAMSSAKVYLTAHGHFTFSLMTRYEILRGLYRKNATTQLAAFDQLCLVSEIIPLTDAIIVRAATIYADLHERGALIGDADILIAATALEQKRVVVTNNEAHYERIANLSLENWLR